MSNQAVEIMAAIMTGHRFEFLKSVAIEISDAIWKNFDDVEPKKTYDIIGIMAEERNVEPGEIDEVVALVMAKLYVNLLGECSKNSNGVLK